MRPNARIQLQSLRLLLISLTSHSGRTTFGKDDETPSPDGPDSTLTLIRSKLITSLVVGDRSKSRRDRSCRNLGKVRHGDSEWECSAVAAGIA